MDDEDDDNDLFDWAGKAYESDNLPGQGDKVDLTQYTVTLGSIYKEPTGEERIDGIEVKKNV